MKIKHIALIIAILSISNILSAQEKTIFGNDNRFYIEQGFRQGHYIPFVSRHAYIKELSQFGFDIKLGKQTDGRETWEQQFNYINYGLLIRYEHNTLDSAKHEFRNQNGSAETEWVSIGDCLSLAGFLNGHLINRNFWSFDYDIVGGVSFWPKYGNEFIGSFMNIHLSIDAGPTFKLTENTDLLARAIFSHSSNGALILPNNGVNVWSYEIGLRHHPQGRSRLIAKQPIEDFKKTTSLYVSESFGMLQSETRINGQIPGEPGYYFGNLVQIGITRQFHPKFRYDFAIDMAWTGETKLKYEVAQIRANEGSLEVSLEDYSPLKATHLAASGLFEILYNNFAFCIGGGYYLYHGIFIGTNEHKTWALAESKMSKFEKQYLPTAYKNYYERLGFKYYFGKGRNTYVGAFMKVHMDSIDYIEWTFGKRLKDL